ncbi:uncharacterized protein MKK02DRAFT_28256 [Dioszegia hungarica]|uniref:Uncharacterized protein n=1 Tax=Dioszegia hungarica TaxID=4972 RepID=A0AA38H7S6_9TREE|nr:uncharacterized protein MKK02DRAFT_28256 [Dioszegia hungarica]KAI9634534.1 hypothetical protein MKK02DRAFT_28256 [Dioszegia hungarica]
MGSKGDPKLLCVVAQVRSVQPTLKTCAYLIALTHLRIAQSHIRPYSPSALPKPQFAPPAATPHVPLKPTPSRSRSPPKDGGGPRRTGGVLVCGDLVDWCRAREVGIAGAEEGAMVKVVLYGWLSRWEDVPPDLELLSWLAFRRGFSGELLPSPDPYRPLQPRPLVQPPRYPSLGHLHLPYSDLIPYNVPHGVHQCPPIGEPGRM